MAFGLSSGEGGGEYFAPFQFIPRFVFCGGKNTGFPFKPTSEEYLPAKSQNCPNDERRQPCVFLMLMRTNLRKG